MKIAIETMQDMTSTKEVVGTVLGLIERLETERQKRFPGLSIVFDDIQVTLPKRSEGESQVSPSKALIAIIVHLEGTSMQGDILSTRLGWGPEFTETEAFDELWDRLLHTFGWNLFEPLPDDQKNLLRVVHQLQRRVPARDDGWVKSLEVSGEGIEDAERKLRGLVSVEFLQEEKRSLGSYGYKIALWAAPYISS